MYFHIITSFFIERKPFSKTWGKINSKNKPKSLNVSFLDTFCICSKKKKKKKKGGGKWCLFFNTSSFRYFWYSLCRKLTKSLALHGFEEIFTHVLIHQVFVCQVCGRLKSPGFSSLYKNPKRGLICKKTAYYWKFEPRVSYQVWFCWQISNGCTFWLA